jgi:hypothetical protein
MVPYQEGMEYLDDPDQNRKSAVLTLEQVVQQIQTNPIAARRCEVLRTRQELSEKDQKHIKMTGLNRLFWGEFDLSSGKFEDKGLSVHPGVMCFDVDKISETQAFYCKSILREDPYCIMAFLSPRGHGIKFLVRTPASSEQHRMRYEGIKEHYEKLLGHKLDPTCSNPARACFMSSDPNPIVNWDAEICTKYKRPEPPREMGVKPPEDTRQTYENAVARVTKQKGKSWENGQKHAFLISLTGTCKAFGISENDFKSLAAEFIIDDAAQRNVIKLYSTK